MASIKLDSLLYCNVQSSKSAGITACFVCADNDRGEKDKNIVFKARTAKKLSYLVTSHRYISSALSIPHSMYLATEFMKAEISLIMKQNYVQM
uniref:DUF4346 domain-containing protein n=1 Tax=Yamadaella caenomyce TaxID=259029 RepID=A0A1G4NYP9_9FLOR|nr:Hypothetical protein ORF_1 [Yamadaella caenomyce]SCW23765.1 Hypothetical protein ORF_1 [Yamadaella caenomyce]